MTDANRVNLAYVAESTFGTTPGGPPTLKDLRYVSESLHDEQSSVTSQEIRSDRQIVDLIRTGKSAAGDIAFELSYGAYDDFIEAALLSAAWTSVLTDSAAGTPTNSSGNISLAKGAGSWAAYPTGSWVRVTCATTTANNGYWKVVSGGGTATLVLGPGTGTATTGSSQTVELKGGGELKAGTTFRSFAIERNYQALSNTFAILNGMTIDTMSLEVAADQVMRGSFGFVGKKETSASATAGTGTNTAAAANPVYNGIDNVVALFEGGTANSITGFTMQLQNSLRARLQVGTLGAISIGTGTIGLTGTLRAYFATSTNMDKFLNATASSLALVVQESALANAYIFEMPRIKYQSGQRVAGGINTDVIADLGWTAYRHSTEGVTLRVHRIA